ncbi:MAG: aldehyde dehydrogenase family protein [Candidatus Limnocylindrales bacterium]
MTAPTIGAPIDAPMRVGGRDVTTAEWITVVNPADTGEVVGRVPLGSAAHATAATAAAAAAFPVWSSTPPAERAARLREAGQALLADAEARGVLLARECGALLSEARGGVLGCTRVLDYYATVGEGFAYEEELPSPNGRVTVAREPMGVAVVIVPWNSPTYLGFLALGPILMAGNTVVVKPPTDAPLALMDSLRVIEPFFPPGTINVVTGPGATVGAALLSDPLVRKVNFTGSTEVGKEVLRLAADTVKRVSLELGGNDPAIVLEDVDLDFVVPELISGVFALSGQICYDVKRIYVQRSRYADFVDRFTAAATEFVVGNGLAPGATMGALVNERQTRWVEGLLDDARQRGAVVSIVGRQLDADAWGRGHFILPAIVTDVGHDADIVRCEQFGPAIPIMPFDTEDEAIGLANDTDFGLAASVWTPDEDRAFRLARRVQAGSTFINVHRRGASGVDMPFGGFKESGLGRGHGVVALEEQFEMHTISSRRPQ